tara:strand:- start:999 stop:1562 length:564 start_codon:yes stop_codon:yes gene_type:complete
MGTFKNMSSMVKPSFSTLVTIILIIYILSETTIPHELFEVINEPMIKIVLVATCLYITMHKPLVGCLSLVAMYELMTRNHMLHLPSLMPSLSPALSPPQFIEHHLPTPSASTKLSKFNNIKKSSQANYHGANDKPSKIMSNLSANQRRITLEEDLVNSLTPYYNHHEEASMVQPILAKQPNKNCVRI